MEIVVALFTGIVIAAVSSWITVNLSLRRYHSEQWWDRRVNAYTHVLDALHSYKATNKRYLDDAYSRSEMSEEQEKELQSRIRSAQNDIQWAMDLSAFLLSPEALEVLTHLHEEETIDVDTWEEHLEVSLEATERCLQSMIRIAKDDLSPEPKLFFWTRRKHDRH